MYVVSRFDDVRDIMARPHLFSNRPNQDETIGFPPKIAPDTPPEVLQQLLAAASALPLDLSELLTARVIVGADPLQHTRQRAIVSRGFTPRRIAEFKDIIERIVAECLTDTLDVAQNFFLNRELVYGNWAARLLSWTNRRVSVVRRILFPRKT